MSFNGFVTRVRAWLSGPTLPRRKIFEKRAGRKVDRAEEQEWQALVALAEQREWQAAIGQARTATATISFPALAARAEREQRAWQAARAEADERAWQAALLCAEEREWQAAIARAEEREWQVAIGEAKARIEEEEQAWLVERTRPPRVVPPPPREPDPGAHARAWEVICGKARTLARPAAMHA
jgi:hypothetical protein